MKLYATTTSERASKGQGGKYLNIEITSDRSILPFCIIEVIEKDEDNVMLSITGWGELEMGKKYTIPKERYTKGKQKKGESFIDTIEKHKQNAFENGIY